MIRTGHGSRATGARRLRSASAGWPGFSQPGRRGAGGTGGHRQFTAWAGATLGLRALTVDTRVSRALSGGAFSVGGPASSLVPQPLSGAWVAEPWLPQGALSGSLHDRVDLRVGSQGAGLFGTRHALRDGQQERAASAFGLRLEATLPAQPLVRLPSVTLDSGLACVVEADGALDLGRCADLDGYAAWISARWGG